MMANEPLAPLFHLGSPGASTYQESIVLSGPSLRVTRVMKWRADLPKNCLCSPVSVVFRSRMITRPVVNRYCAHGAIR